MDIEVKFIDEEALSNSSVAIVECVDVESILKMRDVTLLTRFHQAYSCIYCQPRSFLCL